ncbi:MAG TPA: hypothetical protein VLV31_03615 [Candidatus Acidoferrales bacterium]|nr:hypothetical protein [Candidatus Acidoferrales bacterium]
MLRKGPKKILSLGYHGTRFLALLLLFAVIPLTAITQLPLGHGFSSGPSNCTPGVQNQYPSNATARAKIVIVTTVSSACVYNYNQIAVNILLPNTSDILSMALASPATNTVTAPPYGGPWTLVVQIFWNDYPTGGIIEVYQTTITIKILGPKPEAPTTATAPYTQYVSIKTSTGSYSTTVLSATTSTFSPFSLAVSKSFTSSAAEATSSQAVFSTSPSVSSSSQSWSILSLQSFVSVGAVLLVVAVVIIVGTIVLRRRHGG